MVDPASGLPTIQRLLDQYDKMADCMVSIKVMLQQLKDKMDEVCNDREEHKVQHTNMDKRMDSFDDRLDKLLSWGKAVAICGSALMVALAFLNYAT